MKKKSFLLCLIICVCFIFSLTITNDPVFVKIGLNVKNVVKEENRVTQKNENITFEIYDETGSLIDTKQEVNVGDYFILNNLKAYEIKSIDNKKATAVAECLGEYETPNISFSDNVKLISNKQNKTIGFYMSHNDESYVVGDGVDSVYGEGGIHDITNNLAQKLSDLGVETTVDETLHLPHDSGAYSRSKTTAQELLNDNINFIFDIHRDGAPKKAFVTDCDGKECCQIRIVIGQNNVNQEENLNLATNIFAVGNKLYPDLFKDVYFGKGHYNQNLTKNSLLFEMGSHEVPKELVEEASVKLAHVLNTALFESETNSNGDLVVYKNDSKISSNKVSLLNNKQKTNNK